jgi:O-antigen chain-terminating methyltransferase
MKATEIDVNEIMKEIKEKAARREIQAQSSASSSKPPEEASIPAGSTAQIPFNLKLSEVLKLEVPEAAALLEFRQSYTLADFLNYHDSAFIRNAYRGILGREPDTAGCEHYLEKLRSGYFNKIEILGRLRYSTEGRYMAKKVSGLLLPFAFNTLCRVPFLGYVIRAAAGFLQLPVIIKNIYRFEAYTQWHNNQSYGRVTDAQNQLATYINNATAQLKDALVWLQVNKADTESVTQFKDEIADRLKGKADHKALSALEQSIDYLRLTKADQQAVQQMQQQLAEISTQKNELKELQNKIESTRQQLVEFEQKIIDREEDFARDIDKLRAMLDEEGHIRDAQYVAFEEKFRGTKEEVKERLRIYLAYLEKLPADVKSMPVLDLGCGRGEWLELLQENNYSATGVDVNDTMIQKCRESGLNAVADDAITYLQHLGDQSVGIITGFHLIEHLSFKNRMKLFDEAFRVLAPAGVVIFETPNPENLTVGACEFYSDPTHQRPIPPTSLQYFIEAHGFCKTEIVRLNKIAHLPDDNPVLKELLSVEKDYSVIGYKE